MGSGTECRRDVDVRTGCGINHLSDDAIQSTTRDSLQVTTTTTTTTTTTPFYTIPWLDSALYRGHVLSESGPKVSVLVLALAFVRVLSDNPC